MTHYIQNYLETVLPKFPLEGIKGVHKYLTSEAVLANISLHLGTKDIILASVSIYCFFLKGINNWKGYMMESDCCYRIDSGSIFGFVKLCYFIFEFSITFFCCKN